MSQVVSKVQSTVNAPYGANLSACQLAACISDLDEMQKAVGPVFAFFSEVRPELQLAFIAEMGVDESAARKVAHHIADRVPYRIALAA